MKRKFRLILIFFSVLISLLFISAITTISEDAYAENPELEVHFISVGTGDAILIQVTVNGQNKWLLIDGGYDGDGRDRILPYMKERGVKELEYVIATHYDGDHIGGLDEIFSEITVKNLYGRGGSPIIERAHQDYKIYEAYRAAVETFVPKGERKPANIDLGSVHFELLADGNSPKGVAGQEDGEDVRSIVYLLTYNKFNILLGGDCHSQCEVAILSKLDKVVLYKVHWHGKNVDGKASSQALLEKIRPEISVISEGDHSGRPHEPVLDRLRAVNSKICRTDLHGDIIFLFNDDAWSVKSSKFSEKCPDVFAVGPSGKANWQLEYDSEIWVEIRDAGELVTDNTQVIAVGHDERVLESELARYQIRANVKTNDEPYLLHVVDRFVGAKFDLIVDFDGDNIINKNDFRERSPFEEGKANEEWSSFQVVAPIAQVEQEQEAPEVSSDNADIANSSQLTQLLGISIGLSIAAITIAIVAIVRRR